MSSHTTLPDTAVANVQAFSRVNGMQRDLGHIAYDANEIVRLVSCHHPDDSVRVHAPMEFRNAQLSALALEDWATKPERFTGYFSFPGDTQHGKRYLSTFRPDLTGAVVTLWTGEVIGRITYARVYAHNFGGRVVSLNVTGNNGAWYYGRASWDNGNVIRLRKVK